MQLQPPLPQKAPAADVTRSLPQLAPLAPAARPNLKRPPAPAIDEAVAGANLISCPEYRRIAIRVLPVLMRDPTTWLMIVCVYLCGLSVMVALP